MIIICCTNDPLFIVHISTDPLGGTSKSKLTLLAMLQLHPKTLYRNYSFDKVNVILGWEFTEEALISRKSTSSWAESRKYTPVFLAITPEPSLVILCFSAARNWSPSFFFNIDLLHKFLLFQKKILFRFSGADLATAWASSPLSKVGPNLAP